MSERLQHMSVFARVVASGSFSAAAKDLGVSTAVVSRRVAALESRRGVRLLHRMLLRSPEQLKLNEGEALTLLLGWGEAQTVLRDWALRADAFYLDGFAPARNPEMWSVPITRALARLAAPGATLATYTAARAVRDAIHVAGEARVGDPVRALQHLLAEAAVPARRLLRVEDSSLLLQRRRDERDHDARRLLGVRESEQHRRARVQ